MVNKENLNKSCDGEKVIPSLVVIKIERETREELKKLGIKGETYNDIIKALIAGDSK